MSKECELTEFEWEEIIGFWKGGYSKQDIKDILNCPKLTIHDIIKNYRDS